MKSLELIQVGSNLALRDQAKALDVAEGWAEIYLCLVIDTIAAAESEQKRKSTSD
jgi:hypothetical protein